MTDTRSIDAMERRLEAIVERHRAAARQRPRPGGRREEKAFPVQLTGGRPARSDRGQARPAEAATIEAKLARAGLDRTGRSGIETRVTR